MGRGKGGGGVSAPSPQQQAQAQIQVEQARAQLQQQQAAEAQAREEAQRQQQMQQFQTGLSNARQSTEQQILAAITGRGLDAGQFGTQIQNQLNQVASGIPQGDPNPGSFFNADSLTDTILGRARDQQRQGFTNQLREFAAPGFYNELIPGTKDDPYIQAILGEQFGDATNQLQMAQNRGALNQTGFATGQQQLEQQRRAAEARLQGIGGDILEGGRSQLRDIAGRGFDAAQNFELGQSFDPNVFRGQIDNFMGDFRRDLEGNLRNAVGGEQLFDLSTILQRGGAAQGQVNQPQAPGLVAALEQRNREREQQRGLGTQGVF